MKTIKSCLFAITLIMTITCVVYGSEDNLQGITKQQIEQLSDTQKNVLEITLDAAISSREAGSNDYIFSGILNVNLSDYTIDELKQIKSLLSDVNDIESEKYNTQTNKTTDSQFDILYGADIGTSYIMWCSSLALDDYYDFDNADNGYSENGKTVLFCDDLEIITDQKSMAPEIVKFHYLDEDKNENIQGIKLLAMIASVENIRPASMFSGRIEDLTEGAPREIYLAMQESLKTREGDILNFKKVLFYSSDYGVYYIYMTKDIELIIEYDFIR